MKYLRNILFIMLFLVGKAQAVCPICTVFVGAGVGLSRWLGVDDAITGLWIGGLVVSLIIWTIAWFNKRNYRFIFRKILITIFWYAIIILPLYSIKIMGNPLNVLYGIDKLLFGIIIGSIGFFIGGIWYMYIKKTNNGHALFPFQKVVWPVAPLVVLTLIFYFITR